MKRAMVLPKKYFHDKSIFFLLLSNGLMLLACVVYVLLRVDTSQAAALISYRATLGISGFVSGRPSELYSFAVFALLVTGVNVVLSLRLFSARRLLATAVLALNVVLLIFTFAVSLALIPVR
jgi:hypothetical protein